MKQYHPKNKDTCQGNLLFGHQRGHGPISHLPQRLLNGIPPNQHLLHKTSFVIFSHAWIVIVSHAWIGLPWSVTCPSPSIRDFTILSYANYTFLSIMLSI